MDKILMMLQLFLAVCQTCLMLWMFRNFLRRPHDTLEARVAANEARTTANEVAVKEIRDSLKQGNDRFREQDDANEVIINSVLALVKFEIQYCLIEHKEMGSSLEEAERGLNKYLARRRL